MINQYNLNGFSILQGIIVNNSNIKQYVGDFISEYVEKFVGEEMASVITGMLIDLPLDKIKGYLYDFYNLRQKIFEAREFLTQ